MKYQVGILGMVEKLKEEGYNLSDNATIDDVKALYFSSERIEKIYG